MQLSKPNIVNSNHLIVRVLVTVVLIAIIVNQTAWLSNMYQLFLREFKAYADEELQNAAFMELFERGEVLGGIRFYSQNLIIPNDTSRYISKDVVTEDSTYTFMVDKNDPNTMHKISQFVLKKYLPIDLDRLSAIFKERIRERYNVDDAYFDYLDLENDTLIKTIRPENMVTSHYARTDTVPLDIIDSIGVVGYIENPRVAILDNMKGQLMLSILLMAIGGVALFYISRSFVFQWKTEKMRQDSVNVMTHEFKRPISSAVAMVSTIPFYVEKKNTARVLEYVSNIETALNKLTYYTKRIQQISNNEAGNVSLDKTAVEIVPFFEVLCQRYALLEEDKQKVVIQLQFGTSRKEMEVDMLHFSNVMDNLVENAIKYTVHPAVVIDISVTETAGGIKISVKDNGIGISPADKKHIFDKFYRVKRKETKDKMGFGLGLTYVKSIIEAHGGDITVHSKLNEGSEFVIILKS